MSWRSARSASCTPHTARLPPRGCPARALCVAAGPGSETKTRINAPRRGFVVESIETKQQGRLTASVCRGACSFEQNQEQDKLLTNFKPVFSRHPPRRPNRFEVFTSDHGTNLFIPGAFDAGALLAFPSGGPRHPPPVPGVGLLHPRCTGTAAYARGVAATTSSLPGPRRVRRGILLIPRGSKDENARREGGELPLVKGGGGQRRRSRGSASTLGGNIWFLKLRYTSNPTPELKPRAELIQALCGA